MVAVLLGGSRARSEHMPESDFDLGLYYQPPLNIEALQDLARDIAGPEARVTRPGEWGPWVDGGGWLQIAGVAVDWIYRDLNRVRRSWDDAQAGRYDFHFQIGHPLGVPDFTYVGEVSPTGRSDRRFVGGVLRGRHRPQGGRAWGHGIRRRVFVSRR